MTSAKFNWKIAAIMLLLVGAEIEMLMWAEANGYAGDSGMVRIEALR